MLRRIACAGLLIVAVGLSGCGEDDGIAESLIIGDTLTVYSSLPLRGPLAGVSRDMVRAQKLALSEAGGRAGPYEVSFASLDSSNAETGRWDPGRVAANARRAVQDRQTIAYLGELENGASAVSVPILNEGGILQVSPRDTFGGLTTPGGRGEPEKYYPSGVRTFARLVPGDEEQARSLVAALRAAGVRRLALADDRRLSGSSLGDRVRRVAARSGIEVVQRSRLDAGGEVPDDLGAELRRVRAEAFLYTGTAGPFAAGVLRQVDAGAPGVLLFGSDDLTLSPGLPAAVGPAGDGLVLSGIDPRPQSPGARAFSRRFRAAYGVAPDLQAVLAYDAMRLVLGSIARAGDRASSRRTVIGQALRAARDPVARFTRYRVDGNELVTVGQQL